MTHREEILSQLPGVVGKQHQRLAATVGPRIVRCEIDACDQLAVAAYELVLETPELANVQLEKLQAASENLCARVTYLLEPISSIETDAEGCVVQMRSTPPQQQENGRFYYELFLRRGGSVALHRYEKKQGCIRQRVAATLTHEVLGRLVGDFDATVEEILSM